jgi:transcriptional regulator with XRE-family HTH domain
MIQNLQASSGLSSRQLCRRLGLSSSTFARWQRRSRKGVALLASPGPKKLGPLPLETLHADLALLGHRRKRSSGSTALYSQYSQAISRRELAQLVAAERAALTHQQRCHFRRITWKEPNLAWAMDATEFGRDRKKCRLVLILVVDLASRYSFEPFVSLNYPSAAEVALYLTGFVQAPWHALVLKARQWQPL